MAGVYSAKINHFLTTFAQNGVVNVGIDGKSKERTKKEKSLEFQYFQALKPLIWRAMRDSNPQPSHSHEISVFQRKYEKLN